MASIKLLTSDGEVVRADLEAMRLSNVIRHMLDNLGACKADEEECVLPLLNIDGPTMKKVIEWCDHHKNDPVVEKPVACDDFHKIHKLQDVAVGEWDENFFNVDVASLKKLTMAANFLDIEGMLDNSCKVIASHIKGKSLDHMRKFFGVSKHPAHSIDVD
ncbi:S-phase kinase-associated protein 1 [Copidosoma floridanum]|uniref:S-phase kinase-associated protein 1 n=1 Tax=Copidosoma floridanum TaxID=29053 RepID=UPI0006C9865F|nr:S-phase kinase-associated protein 1 [Copidosoma floridanum]XP_014219407.1 S-phase kinase-associated protein 1 [Copidosoma floridanum]